MPGMFNQMGMGMGGIPMNMPNYGMNGMNGMMNMNMGMNMNGMNAMNMNTMNMNPMNAMNMNGMNTMNMNPMNVMNMNQMNGMNMNQMNAMNMNQMNAMNMNQMNAMNMNGMMGINNDNLNMAGLNKGGNNNWMQGYNQINKTGNISNEEGKKITVVFAYTAGGKKPITILIDHGKTVNELIKIYFARIGQPELIEKKNDIFFLYNAQQINCENQEKVEKFFKFNSSPTILVSDLHNLIGA